MPLVNAFSRWNQALLYCSYLPPQNYNKHSKSASSYSPLISMQHCYRFCYLFTGADCCSMLRFRHLGKTHVVQSIWWRETQKVLFLAHFHPSQTQTSTNILLHLLFQILLFQIPLINKTTTTTTTLIIIFSIKMGQPLSTENWESPTKNWLWFLAPSKDSVLACQFRLVHLQRKPPNSHWCTWSPDEEVKMI